MTDRKAETEGGPSGRLLVIGGGYAGVTAANRIRSSLTPTEAERFRVVLVCPRAELVDRLRLHQLAAGTRDEVSGSRSARCCTPGSIGFSRRFTGLIRVLESSSSGTNPVTGEAPWAIIPR